MQIKLGGERREGRGEREELSDLLTHGSKKEWGLQGDESKPRPSWSQRQKFLVVLAKAVAVHAGFRGLVQQTERNDLLKNIKLLLFSGSLSLFCKNEETMIYQPLG